MDRWIDGVRSKKDFSADMFDRFVGCGCTVLVLRCTRSLDKLARKACGRLTVDLVGTTVPVSWFKI
jgi:hypothetical protein